VIYDISLETDGGGWKSIGSKSDRDGENWKWLLIVACHYNTGNPHRYVRVWYLWSKISFPHRDGLRRHVLYWYSTILLATSELITGDAGEF
jgi:hypothetical protein